MKRNLPAILIVLFCLFSINLIGSNPDEWNVYFENDTVKIEYTYQVCDFSSTAKQEIIIFKFTNLIHQNISVNYNANIWHNDICISCNQNEESSHTIQIASDETIIFDCKDERKDAVIFSAFITNTDSKRYESLTKFELNEITISYE